MIKENVQRENHSEKENKVTAIEEEENDEMKRRFSKQSIEIKRKNRTRTIT